MDGTGVWIEIPRMAIALILGLAIGSFLNVVIYRIPAGLSLLWPPSHCPQCQHRISKADNIPVFGWLALKGKCRYCQTPISKRYPLIEATTGILFLAVYLWFGWSGEALGYGLFLSWLLALAIIDTDTLTLPNVLTQWGLVAGLAYQLLQGIGRGLSPHPLRESIIGAILGLWLFEAIIVVGSIAFGQAAMGAGDAKLASGLGAWLGWKMLLVAGFLACTLGAILGIGAIATGKLKRRQKMPFGPFLALGGAIALFVGEIIITTYQQILFSLNLIG